METTFEKHICAYACYSVVYSEQIMAYRQWCTYVTTVKLTKQLAQYIVETRNGRSADCTVSVTAINGID